MSKNIKSLYFIKLVFLYIDERQKLKIVQYNKSLQKNLDISIINYKHISGKYLIFQTNGIGKEYDGYDDLIFEGEYLNRKRNGKAKEYWIDTIKFEGEYLKGKRNGKGKEYYSNGTLKFEGEYLNNLIWNGKGYDKFNTIIYELKDGKGKVKEYTH